VYLENGDIIFLRNLTSYLPTQSHTELVGWNINFVNFYLKGNQFLGMSKVLGIVAEDVHCSLLSPLDKLRKCK